MQSPPLTASVEMDVWLIGDGGGEQRRKKRKKRRSEVARDSLGLYLLSLFCGRLRFVKR